MTEKDTEMITPYLKIDLAQERTDYRSRAAIARGRTQPRAHGGRPVASEKGVTLRFGSRADEASLARLAALDSSKPPAQPVLLAEVDGQLLAAAALSDGTVIADPFHPTLDLIELLRARARQLNGDARTGRSGRPRAWSRLRAPAREYA